MHFRWCPAPSSGSLKKEANFIWIEWNIHISSTHIQIIWSCSSFFKLKWSLDRDVLESIYSLRQLLTFDHELVSPCSEGLPSPFLSQLTWERVIYYLKRKLYYRLFERSFETVRIFVMGGSRWVLVKVVLFEIRSTKTRLEHFMAKILTISKLLSNNG